MLFKTKLQTFLWFSEEGGNERFFGFLHELNHALLDRILVLVQPAVNVILHLLHNTPNDVSTSVGPLFVQRFIHV